MSATERRFLAGALVVAYAMRMLHWRSLAPYPWFDFLGLDALYYDEWAKRILRDGLQGKDPFFMGPLYPYVLAGLYKLFGTSLDVVRHFQVFLAVASVAVVHALGRRLGDARLAMVCSGVTAVYGPLVYYTTSILYPTLLVFLSAVLLVLLWDAAARRSVRLALAAGLVLGVYALGRGNILLFAPLALGWLLAAWGHPERPSLRGWRAARGAGLALAGGALLGVLPATIHNARTGDPTLLTTNGGLNFYIGNGPMANGGHVTPILFVERPGGVVETIEADLTKDVECRTEAERATGHPMTYTEVSSFWYHETLRTIRKDPGRFVSGLVMKTVHFWSTYEIPQIEHFGYFRRYSLPLRGPVLAFGLVGPLALVGVGMIVRRPGRWWLPLLFTVAYSTSIVLFFVLARYRLPVLPALFPFAAMAALRIVDAARARRWGRVAPPVGAAAALAWLMQANFYGIDESKGVAQILYRHGIVEDSRGNPTAAIDWYEQALALKPDYEKGHLNLGVDLARVGRREEGLEHLLTSERLDPHYPRAPFNRGAVLEDLGRHDEALQAYARAVELEPRYLQARLALAEMQVASADTAAARAQLDAILSYDGRWDPETHDAVRAQAHRWIEYLHQRGDLAAQGRGTCFEESALFRLAEVSRVRGRLQEALGVLRLYFEGGGRCAEAYVSLGRILLTAGEIAGCEDALQRAGDLDPDFPELRLLQARAAASRGDGDAALALLREQLRRHPADVDAMLEAGLVEERLHDDGAAAAEWFRRYESAGGDPAAAARRRASWAPERGLGSATP